MTTINSNFDINSELVPALMPPVNTDVLGAFRFVCGPGQVRADDPIVYPNQPGASHLHQFFGNTGANASSTYESLRSSGMSTCMSPLNRSAYWMPAMLDGTGNVVRPDFVTIYYKRRPASDPKCSLTSGDPQAEANCIPLPNGLRFVFGYDMLNPSKNDPNNPPFVWECNGPTAQPGTYKNIPEALAHCPAGNQLGFSMQAWHCWDGKNLDSPDHRSHMSFVYNTGMGYFRCPADKPFAPPSFIISAWWTILPTDTPSKWMLASDAMHPELPHGSTLHADWFGAWDPQTMAMWNDNCINKRLSCAGGVLGNGLAMKTYADFTWTANPHLVPIP
jgi:hypothetical protein